MNAGENPSRFIISISFSPKRGGEEAASQGLAVIAEPIGPGIGLLDAFGGDAGNCCHNLLRR